ncbi:hypothetical protein CEXT_803291 [Caerostris extrusa]|uniref:Uncharacterized protein n=1 Tax=Caerostris extrusa TaxID=172846 RepID=A0AAV4QW67_CAEEX|nr:hypothetical protein CEXT_803291 [Caerostris extrusa]
MEKPENFHEKLAEEENMETLYKDRPLSPVNQKHYSVTNQSKALLCHQSIKNITLSPVNHPVLYSPTKEENAVKLPKRNGTKKKIEKERKKLPRPRKKIWNHCSS